MNIILLFSKNTTLSLWKENGSIDRELSIYHNFIRRGHDVTLITFGNSKDLKYEEHLKNIKIICNKYHFSKKLYYFYLKNILPLSIKNKPDTVIITQQYNSIDFAIKIGLNANIPVIFRCGYIHSLFMKYQYGIESPQYKKAIIMEKLGCESSSAIFVTADYMKNYFINNFNVNSEKIYVLPNYVDTKKFKPLDVVKDNSISYVGSLKFQKNSVSFIEALNIYPSKLKIACAEGNDYYIDEIKQIIEKNDLDVELNIGTIDHDELPDFLNSSEIFILPSLYEGHPKALIEAMSCGLPVIGTNVEGINNIIEHKVNGYLCGESSHEIAQAIKTVYQDHSLRKKIGKNAREYVINNYSLTMTTKKQESYFSKVFKLYYR